ncbi:MAG: hypothetical protein M9947_03475 [Thermomicrobiales bacterium]|nr:hypothetical protein [Thermomicrobiales bacterium]
MFDVAPLARESRTDTPNTETALAFYTALNAALAGASPEPLEHLLSSIFVDRHSETGTSRTGTEFLTRCGRWAPVAAHSPGGDLASMRWATR